MAYGTWKGPGACSGFSSKEFEIVKRSLYPISVQKALYDFAKVLLPSTKTLFLLGKLKVSRRNLKLWDAHFIHRVSKSLHDYGIWQFENVQKY